MADSYSLRSSSLRDSSHLRDAESDPMASMGNLMDVMLVFACALLIALVTHYNVELSPDASTPAPALEKVEGNMEAGELSDVATEGLSSVGTLYRDDETGELYVLAE